MSQLNFNQLISQAKEIDKEIIFLKTKVMEPSKFGLGRDEAIEVLKGLDKEIFSMKSDCSQELKNTKEEYERMLSDIKNVKDYLKNVSTNLDKIEREAVKYGYQTFEIHCSKERNITDSLNISGITELSMADSQLTPVTEHNFHSSTPKRNIFTSNKN